jgi:FkbM family methyltransferase
MACCGHGMTNLFIEDRLKALLPGWLYFPQKIAIESRRTEPELAMLRALVRPQCTAIDVGANRGLYSYALAAIAGHVEAFEPNPAMVAFNRRKASRKVRIHEVALSNREGAATFYIPHTQTGHQAHLIGSLRSVDWTDQLDRIEVRVATLDSFDFKNVGFIKIDVEGAELEVIEGARQTIGRDRPNLLVELLTRPDDVALTAIAQIEDEYSYDSWLVAEGKRQPARLALRDSRSAIKTRNVLFTPR